MTKRSRRRPVDRGGELANGAARADREGHVVELALDVRLLGRLRLLTIDAVVQIAEKVPVRSVLPVGGVARSFRPAGEPRPPSLRRVDAEALLDDAGRTLVGAGRFGDDGESASPRGDTA